MQENLIDSRFKILTSDLRDDVDELKGKVNRLEITRNTNNEDATKTHNSYHHSIEKRANNASSKRESCQSASLFCTFYYPDHPDSNRKIKGKYSATVNELKKDPSKVKGIPTSCKDLRLLGHQLNGLYSVKTTQPNQSPKIETVFCDFQSSSPVLT